MTDESKVDLIFELIFGNISESDFTKRYGIESNEFPSEVAKLVRQAHKTRNGDLLEAALSLGFHYRFPDEFLEEIQRLVPLKWHTEHEYLIELLQAWKRPESIPFLVEAIKEKPSLDYLEYDDYGSYYKRCLWALVAIGTEDARTEIIKLTLSEIPELQEEAVYRLSKFDEDADWSRKQDLNIPYGRLNKSTTDKPDPVSGRLTFLDRIRKIFS